MLLPALLALLVPLAGETVRSVDIVAPHEERYAPYLSVAPGQPYDPERVRQSVLRLYATGDFEDVVVEAESDASGVALVFRTSPAPRLREVVVRGEPTLSADRLRHALRLRPKEPLWPARLETAAKEATATLTADGWHEAKVSAEALLLDDAADLVLTVHAGPRVHLRFAKVDAPAGAPLLTDLMRPGHGEVYRREKAEGAAERMRQRMAQAGFWRTVVELQETRVPGSAQLDLVFVARPGPLVSVEVRGFDLPRGRRSEVGNLLREGAARPDALEAGAERIEDYLRSEGHRDALVRYHSEAGPSGDSSTERVVYDVTPGPQATVVAAEVRGAPVAPDLAALVKTRAGMPLRDDVLAEDTRVLREALHARGHAEAKVEVVVRDGGGQLPVVFRVEAGPATTVSAVTVEAAVGLGDEARTELRLREGVPYEARTLAADRSRILTAYRNAGYLEATVEPELSFSEDRSQVGVVFRVTPGPRADVGQIVVTGLERTREKVVLREVTLETGRPLSLEKLLESQRALSALGLFERVSLTPLDEGPGEARDLLVSLSEAPITTFAYGLGYSERDLFRGSVEVTRRNLFGLDRTLTAFARVAFRGQRFVLSYREPYFLGRRRDFFATAFYDDEDRTSFDFTRLGGVAQTTRRLGTTRAVILRLTYQKTDVFNVEVPIDQVDRSFRDYTLAGPSFSLVEDSRDNPLDARRGHFLSADMLVSAKFLGGAQFAKTFLQAVRYTRLRRELSLAVSARVGLAATFGEEVPSELPLPERFFAGGDYTVRGFAIDTVGPQEEGADGELFPTGGNALLLGSAELRRDVGRALTLAAFLDLGNVYPLVSDIRLSELRYSAGLGLRYRTPLGPLRLDWGVKLNPQPGESGYHIHLTVGNAY